MLKGWTFTFICCAMNFLSAQENSFAHAPINVMESMDNLKLLISQDEIKRKIKETAQLLDGEYKGEEVTVILVMKGALCIAADLIREMKSPTVVEYVSASSYGQRGTDRGELKINGFDQLHLTGKNVLLIDDIFDSGMTLSAIASKIKSQEPKSLQTLVLLAKNVARGVSDCPDHALFQIENQFVVGYGLDYKEHYRGLPGIFYFKSAPQ